jgi:hypothetical protein
MARRKADWCDIGLTVEDRGIQESAAWNVTPKRARTRFAGKRAVSFDPPTYALPLDEMTDTQLYRYIKSRCQRKPPKGRYLDTVPLARRRRRSR